MNKIPFSPAPLPCIKTKPLPNAITAPCRLRLKICLTALSLLTAALPVAAAPETAKTTDNPLAAYPKARNTWGDILNPSGIIPAQGYAAYSINQQSPRQTVAQENVDNIAINYVSNYFHGIPSEQFAAYWVGRLHVPQKAWYRVSRSPRYETTRVLLDKHIIIEGEENTSLELDAGDYLLEVEHLSQWQTVGVLLNFAPEVRELDDAALRDAIAAQKLPAGTVAYAVGTRESKNRDYHIYLQAPAGDTPYILLLGSDNAVQWEVIGRAPQLVIYNQAQKGSSVRTDGGNTPLLAWKGRIHYGFVLHPQTTCSCIKEEPHCTHDLPLSSFATDIKTLTGIPLAGYSGDSDKSIFNIPEITLNAAVADNSEAEEQAAYEAARAKCRQKVIATDNVFETLMQDKQP